MTGFWVLLACAGALFLAADAGAGDSRGYEDMRATVCGLVTLKSDIVPAKGRIQRINVWANGKQIDGKVESRRRAIWAGRGVAVAMSFSSEAAPLVFRVANLRTRRCSRVRITYLWRAV